MKICLTLVPTLLVASSDMPVLAGHPQAPIADARNSAQAARAGAFDIDGRTIRYVEYGRGMATILVRGGFARTAAFQKQIPALAANFRVILFETIGSPVDGQAGRDALMPADVDALLHHLAIRRGDVVSFSDAGLVGFHLASQPLRSAPARSVQRDGSPGDASFVDAAPAKETLTQP
jgi:pimeloyl-ACP methyl ester carboxylesterase